MLAAGFQYGDDFGEYLYHGSIGARLHGLDDDYIKVVDVGNKHILHTFEAVDREGTGDVGIMVPIIASASTAKQNISCIAKIS
jgi:hypothetical protein